MLTSTLEKIGIKGDLTNSIFKQFVKDISELIDSSKIDGTFLSV